jgi:hypothetical protein
MRFRVNCKAALTRFLAWQERHKCYATKLDLGFAAKDWDCIHDAARFFGNPDDHPIHSQFYPAARMLLMILDTLDSWRHLKQLRLDLEMSRFEIETESWDHDEYAVAILWKETTGLECVNGNPARLNIRDVKAKLEDKDIDFFVLLTAGESWDFPMDAPWTEDDEEDITGL